ncbi:hypothetical protein H5P35_11420 [Mycobacterium haemophilum DSM 44634]|nr:hypothetical protein [Mycobacterium haemophilum DSM 44634]
MEAAERCLERPARPEIATPSRHTDAGGRDPGHRAEHPETNPGTFHSNAGSAGYPEQARYSGHTNPGPTRDTHAGHSRNAGETGHPGGARRTDAGEAGHTGASGYAGEAGHTGASGYAGEADYTGASGYAGEAGYAGASGYAGDAGYAGASGYADAGPCYTVAAAACHTRAAASSRGTAALGAHHAISGTCAPASPRRTCFA